MSSVYTNLNRKAWDLLTGVHVKSDFYDVDAFRTGAMSLKTPELTLVGDPRGLRLLHLQCHFGLDTLSWARLGAQTTGIDFSSVAISQAKALAQELNLDATFYCHDVQELPEAKTLYDIAISTYGVLCWLSDLSKWAKGISQNLRVGGRFILVEFHPILETIYSGKMTGAGAYFPTTGAVETLTHGTYADRAADISYCEYRWQYPISMVINALVAAGFHITELNEYPFSSYGIFEDLAQSDDGLWRRSENIGKYPYMYSIVARKAAI